MILKNGAFTLVELAIVLIIIGLITGGVVGAQSLIRGAQIQSIAVDLNKYKTALNAYQLEYDAYPGDHSEAYDYWGTNCDSSESFCNGDGDGVIGHQGLTVDETVMFWKHLELAEIIDQGFIIDSTNITPGVSCPLMDYVSIKDGEICLMPYPFRYGHEGSLRSRGLNGDVAEWPKNTAIIDSKIDDGMPYTGIMKAHGNGCFAGSPLEYVKSRDASTPTYNCVWYFHLYGYNNDANY